MKTHRLAGVALALGALAVVPEAAGKERGGRPEGRAERRAGGGERRGRLLAHLDRDEDGRVSREEFLALAHFDRIDRDGDGALTRDELEAARRERARQRLERWLERADADGDGRVTREEAQARRAERFDALDRNGDGALERGELERPAPDARERAQRDEE